MTSQFENLYQKYQPAFKEIVSTLADKELGGPFLMSPGSLYSSQPNPLLVIGQETFGWSSAVNDVQQQMNAYSNFKVGEGYYASPFWNVIRKVEQALGNEPYSCAWTNVSKFDVERKRAAGHYKKAISALDPILIEELQILQPKVCLFFTGPDFDERLTNLFQGLRFKSVNNYDIRRLCHLEHSSLPALTFRTYHANYLRRSKMEPDFISLINKMVLDQA